MLNNLEWIRAENKQSGYKVKADSIEEFAVVEINLLLQKKRIEMKKRQKTALEEVVTGSIRIQSMGACIKIEVTIVEERFTEGCELKIENVSTNIYREICELDNNDYLMKETSTVGVSETVEIPVQILNYFM